MNLRKMAHQNAGSATRLATPPRTVRARISRIMTLSTSTAYSSGGRLRFMSVSTSAPSHRGDTTYAPAGTTVLSGSGPSASLAAVVRSTDRSGRCAWYISSRPAGLPAVVSSASLWSYETFWSAAVRACQYTSQCRARRAGRSYSIKGMSRSGSDCRDAKTGIRSGATSERWICGRRERSRVIRGSQMRM